MNINNFGSDTLVSYNQIADDLLKDKKDLIGIQIGSYSGQLSFMLTQKYSSFQKFYCIDTWNYHDDAQKCFDKTYQNVKNICKIKKDYKETINDFQDNSIDILIINNVDLLDMRFVLESYYPKLKKDGFLIGNNFDLNANMGIVSVLVLFFQKQPDKIYMNNSFYYKRK